MEITEGQGIIQSENYPSNYPGRFHQNSTELELDRSPGTPESGPGLNLELNLEFEFSESHKDDARCRWILIGDEIKLTVNAFDVEMDSVCQYDFVTLRTHSEVDLVRGEFMSRHIPDWWSPEIFF